METNLLKLGKKLGITNKWRVGIVFCSLSIVIISGLAYWQAHNSIQKIKKVSTPQHIKRSNSPVKISSSKKVLAPSATQTPTSKVLFFDPLNGANRIVTNEFVHWSKSSCPYKSSIWDMTSGTLLVRNGAGYSGVPTLEKTVPCESSTQTNSAIFRLNTKRNDFSNVTVSMDYDVIAHGGGGASNNVYDGIHIWVGYKNQYSLYAVTIYRWDGTIVTKKKVPQSIAQCTTPSNDGCYYPLAKDTVRKDITTPGVWHHVDVIYATGTDGLIHITTVIDGVKAADVADTDTHGPAYTSGAVGVRGDNTEFYFKNFTVTQL